MFEGTDEVKDWSECPHCKRKLVVRCFFSAHIECDMIPKLDETGNFLAVLDIKKEITSQRTLKDRRYWYYCRQCMDELPIEYNKTLDKINWKG